VPTGHKLFLPSFTHTVGHALHTIKETVIQSAGFEPPVKPGAKYFCLPSFSGVLLCWKK